MDGKIGNIRRQVFATALFAAAILALGSCWKDSLPASQFIDDFEFHFSFGDFGKGRNFTNPLNVLMTNTTEQFSYRFESAADGTALVSGIMPGQYTVTVSGSLTAEEAASVGTDTDGEPLYLSGFISGLGLHIGLKPEIRGSELIAVSSSPIIFKELYYAGSTTPNNGTYRNDTFFSIYNNSSKPQDIGKLYIGMNEFYGGLGEAGPLWPGEEAGNYTNVYLKSVWKIVAGGKSFVMQPGQTAVIATMAAPHNKYPDLNAANMEMAFWPDYGYLWRPSVFGQGMVLIEASAEEFAAFEKVTLPETFQDPFEDEEYWNCLKVPYDFVVDAVDLIQNETATNTKRFSPVLDAGFATTGAIYKGLSVRRKSLISTDGRLRLQDTNNSTEDFVINAKPLSE